MKTVGSSFVVSLIINCLIFGLLYFLNQTIFPFWVYLIGVFGVAAIIYGWVETQNKIQKKEFTKQLYEYFPELKNDANNENQDLAELAKRIHTSTQNQSSEIDLLLKQETYRREFLGNVSHELKTPLFSIQGFLLTLIEGGLEDENIRDKYLNRINKSVERLIYIVKDLDLISELENGNLRLEQRPFNIQALTQEVFDLLEMKATNNAVTLEFDQNYDDPIRVIGDIERIEQVMINLVSNAIKHSSRPTKVIVGFQKEEDLVRIEITDYGVGIKQEQLPRVFERFYRVDRSRSREIGGSGLGLAIVKHILEAHGEKVYVESEYGRKTKFWFHLLEHKES